MPFMNSDDYPRELVLNLLNTWWDSDSDSVLLDNPAATAQIELIATLVAGEPDPVQFVRDYAAHLVATETLCEDGFGVCSVTETDCCDRTVPVCQTSATDPVRHGDVIVCCRDGYGCQRVPVNSHG